MNPLQALANLIRREPVVITSVVGTGLAVGASFGLHLNAETTKEVIGGAAVLASFIGRSQVTPASGATFEGRLAALEAKLAVALPAGPVANAVQQVSTQTAVVAQESANTAPLVSYDDALKTLEGLKNQLEAAAKS